MLPMKGFLLAVVSPGTELAAVAAARDKPARSPSSVERPTQQGRNTPPGARPPSAELPRASRTCSPATSRPRDGPRRPRALCGPQRSPPRGRARASGPRRTCRAGRPGRGAEQLAPGPRGLRGGSRGLWTGQKEGIKPRWQLRGDG